MIKKKMYGGKYPPAAKALMEAGKCSAPRQYEQLRLSKHFGLDIVYTLKNMHPAEFKKWNDHLKLLAFQEAMRYNEYKWKFAGFEVKLGRLSKGRDLPEIATFQSAMHDDCDIMVFGPGYEVEQRHFLYHKVEDILDLAKRYKGQVSQQRPYKVVQLFIKIRDPR